MDTRSQHSKRKNDALSSLNAAIEAVDVAKEGSTVIPATDVYDSVSTLLTMIRVRFLLSKVNSGLTHNQDSMVNKPDYVQLGLTCADLCRALNQGMGGMDLYDLSQSVCEEIDQLSRWAKSVVRGLGVH